MSIISRDVQEGEFVYCHDCDRERQVYLTKLDPEDEEPTAVACSVCNEILAEIEPGEEDDDNDISIDNKIIKLKTL